MTVFGFLRRHTRMTAQANAYADGELRGEELAGFERHLSGCEQCRASVQSARTLKAALANMPAAAAPRSFAVTPAMLREAAPRPEPARGGTPLYLGLARAGAALSVVAFATVLAFGAFDSNSNSGDDATAGAARDGASAEYAAPIAEPETTKDLSFDDAAAPTSTPVLAPAATGGASGSSVSATPVPPSTGIVTPEVPATGRTTVETFGSPLASDNGTGVQVVPDAAGGQTATIGEASTALEHEDDDGSPSAAIWLGALAGAAVLLVAGLEVGRRVRRG
jgi:hypothetical protein